MSVSKWAWTEECDNRVCCGDCDQCGALDECAECRIERVRKLIVEDVKSPATRTRVYEIKRKLMQERFGIEVREV